MTRRLTDIAPRRAALIAGFGYLLIFMLAIFANFFVRERLIDPDDAGATFTNIADSEFLLRLGLVGFLIVFVIDVVIAWALYILFQGVNASVSLLAAWFRLVYTAFLGVALIFFFVVLQLASGAAYLAAFEQGALDAQVMLSLDAFDYAWLIGLVSFGLHLMLLGYLMLASGFVSRALGVLLTVAGAAYVFDTLAHALLSSYDDHATVFLLIVAVPSVVAELAFTVWLLARGGRQQEALG
ncbi:MAG: DUF4386 domain-containing protein [Thermoleophilia bacterium]|nr:DUF4386 domain-containing protein [Thermoleophilia bacterium]